jgi:hypothetical protein
MEESIAKIVLQTFLVGIALFTICYGAGYYCASSGTISAVMIETSLLFRQRFAFRFRSEDQHHQT